MARRVATAILVGGFMCGGAAYRQAGGTNKSFHRWSMYRELGNDVCALEFRQRKADETWETLDSWKVLGVQKPASTGERLVRNEGEARSIAKHLCHALGEGADVHVGYRCGGPRGWVTVLDGEENLCASP